MISYFGAYFAIPGLEAHAHSWKGALPPTTGAAAVRVIHSPAGIPEIAAFVVYVMTQVLAALSAATLGVPYLSGTVIPKVVAISAEFAGLTGQQEKTRLPIR